MDFDKYIEKLSAALVQFGPQAADLALTVGRVGAVNELVSGFAALALAVVLLRYAVSPLFRKVRDAGYDDPLDPLYFCGSFFLSIVCAALLVGSAMSLTDIYAWVGLWKPEIYLAAKALKL